LDGIILTQLKQIDHQKGDIYHAMKRSDDGYDGFGEAYFSYVNQGEIKGWKKHTKMTLNLVVPVGKIEFVVYEDIKKEFFSIVLSQHNYKRLTIKPGLWLAFRGIEDSNLLLNIANIEHDPSEAVTVETNKISYEW